MSYNNAALAVAGRIVEVVTGRTYEQAVREMLLEPLGMQRSFFLSHEIMTERFVVEHHRSQEGEVSVARPWHMGRYGNPMGGMVSNAADQIAWARFHLDGGVAPDGTRLLAEDVVRRMQEPTVECPGSAIGGGPDQRAPARRRRRSCGPPTAGRPSASTRSSRWSRAAGSR